MKNILILSGIGLALYFAFGKKKENTTEPGEVEEQETAFRELTDAEALNYLNQNIDLASAYGKDNLEKAKEHWRIQGWEHEFHQGGRPSPYSS